MTDVLPDDEVLRRTTGMAPVAVELLMRSVRGESEEALQQYLLPILTKQCDDGLLLVQSALALVGYTAGTAGGLAREARLVGFHPERWLREYAATLSDD